MKIFVDNYKPIQLLHILHNLEIYFHSKETRVEIYSDSGIFYIKNNYFKELCVNDIPSINLNIKVNLLDFNLILDKSKVLLKEVNHLPNNHVSNYITSMKYCLDKSFNNPTFISNNSSNSNNNNKNNSNSNNNNKLFLVIEGHTPSPNPSPNPSHDKIDLPENNYNHSNFIPNNFYFEIDEEKYSLEECKNDLIVFLSLLK